MTPQEEVTRKALALVSRYSWGWLTNEITGLVKVDRARKFASTHAWDIDQATAINSRYERLILNA
jgi:hypothetical protein